MRTSELFGVKISDFSKFMMCRHGKGEEIEPQQAFC